MAAKKAKAYKTAGGNGKQRQKQKPKIKK